MTHVLGVLIAFVTVLLLLSLVVTGLVQATQGALRIRSKNLLVAVAAVLDKHWGKERGWSRKQLLEHAAQVLNADNIAVVDHVDKAGSTVRRRWLGPRVSWAPPKELAQAAHTHMTRALPPAERKAAANDEQQAAADAGGRKKGSTESLEHDFDQLSPALSKRFQRFIRLWTILYAFVVAFAFQVSAPQLLASFASGERATEPFVENVDRTLENFDPTVIEGNYESVAGAALDQLSQRYPQHADLIAEAGTEDTTKQGLKDEMLEVLYEVPQRDEITRVYGDYLDELANAQAGRVSTATSSVTASQQADEALARLDAFGITFWKDPKFYGSLTEPKVDALVGVLLTAILLSFGAPFWFEQLRNLAALRDLRAPQKPAKPDKPKGTQDSAPEGVLTIDPEKGLLLYKRRTPEDVSS